MMLKMLPNYKSSKRLKIIKRKPHLFLFHHKIKEIRRLVRQLLICSQLLKSMQLMINMINNLDCFHLHIRNIKIPNTAIHQRLKGCSQFLKNVIKWCQD